METKHTPGPWAEDAPTLGIEIGDDGWDALRRPRQGGAAMSRLRYRPYADWLNDVLFLAGLALFVWLVVGIPE